MPRLTPARALLLSDHRPGLKAARARRESAPSGLPVFKFHLNGKYLKYTPVMVQQVIQTVKL